MITSKRMEFKRIKKVNVVDNIIEQLTQSIISGGLKVGDRIPPEEELVKILGVGRTSVREALKTIEALNLVRRNRTGTFVVLPNGEVLGKVFQCIIALHGISLEELYDLRMILESHACGLAAEKATEQDIKKLQTLLNKVLEEALPREDVGKLFVRFHLGIAEAGKNKALAEVMKMLKPLLLYSQTVTLKEEGMKEKALESHRKILEVIASRDVKKAQVAMQEHISSVYDKVLIELETQSQKGEEGC